MSAAAALLSSFLTVTPAARAGEREAADVAPAVRAALEAMLTVPAARLEVVGVEGARADGGCKAATPGAHVEAERPIDGSGRFAVKIVSSRAGGAPCEAWLWARVRVLANVKVTRRAVRAGEALAPAVGVEEREIRPGHAPLLELDGQVADRSLGVGQMIEADYVRAPGLPAGMPIKVVILSGALAIEQTGRTVTCPRGRTCAVLPSGKHIEGTLVDGRLMVNVP